jgi:hypothetical protein
MDKIVNPELDFEKRHRLVREIIETIILTAVMFLVIRFAVQNYCTRRHYHIFSSR